MAEKKEKPDKLPEPPGTTDPGIKSEAPEGFRELKPGKQVCFGTRTFSAARFYREKVGDSVEIKREKQKNRFVPETVIKMLKLKDNLFL